MKQVSVTLENKPGELANVCDALGKVGVNINQFFGAGMDSKGFVNLITNDDKSAQRALEKLGYKVEVSDLITVKLFDRPGELAKVARKLAHAHVNIETIYLLTPERGEGTVALRVSDPRLAQEALR